MKIWDFCEMFLQSCYFLFIVTSSRLSLCIWFFFLLSIQDRFCHWECHGAVDQSSLAQRCCCSVIVEVSAVWSTRDLGQRHCRHSHLFVSVFVLLCLGVILPLSAINLGNRWGKASTPYCALVYTCVYITAAVCQTICVNILLYIWF